MRKWTRTILTLGSTGALLAFVGAVFWWQDLQYSYPRLAQRRLLKNLSGRSSPCPPRSKKILQYLLRPLLLHFFNPNCPCSRFNLDHVRSLVQKHRGAVEFVAVLQGDSGERLLAAFESLNRIGIPAVADPGGKIAPNSVCMLRRKQ